jgi:foldase protein PrsA
MENVKLKINIKTAIIIAIIALLGVLGYIFKGFFIAATVDGNPISRLAIIQKLEKASGESLLDNLITEKLIENEARAKKIVVSNNEVNEEIKRIEDQIAAQGGALDAALLSQGMTMDELKEQIILQKKVEKLLADKLNVTDEEVAKYVKDNKVPITKEELRSQKLNQEANILITTLKSEAKIRYFVNY